MKKSMQRLTRHVVSDVCYWTCEQLCGFVGRRTSCEILNAAGAIAAMQTLNIGELINVPEDHLPEAIRHSLPAFTSAEWREVLSFARDNQRYIEEYLERHPEWAHLRCKPID